MVYVVCVKTRRYPTDLTVSQWFIIQHLIPAAKPGGRPRSLEMRLVVAAILCLTAGGIHWRMLPSSFPPWQSVYTCFRQWRDDGAWRRLHETVRVRVRQRFGFRLQPVLRPQEQRGFSVLPRRWLVARSFAWLGLNRRLCKDDERLPESSVASIHIL